MSRRKPLWVSIFLFSFCLITFADADKPAKTQTGYALLDRFITTFQELARSGSGREILEPRLQALMKDAKKAFQQKEIDSIFFLRFKKLLALSKLISTLDPENILEGIISRQTEDFVRDTLGEDIKQARVSVGQLAMAISEEIIDLHLYLDNWEARENLRKKFMEDTSKITVPQKMPD